MPRLFGTDGVRGVANKELLPELAFKLGRAVGFLAVEEGKGKVLVGRDPRISGEMLSAALTAGLTSAGADCLDLGIIPTPAVALICRQMEADFGAVISASHNPYDDNGIKFFDKNGMKLSEEDEERIAAYVVDDSGQFVADELPRPVGDKVGRVYSVSDAKDRYADFLLSTADFSLDGYKIVVDCANGATSEVAPKVYESLGAKVILINADPDGVNINQIPLQVLRENIGYVPQDNVLFSSTVAENIDFAATGKGREEIEKFAKIAQVYDNIIEFPRQFETMVGERGVTLSGGQKQRIAIARALIKEPQILIMDDSLSAVDTETEEAILQNLQEFFPGRTVIIVSHRISTLQGADQILVLEDGQITQRGRHEELIQVEGLYKEMHEKQLLEKQIESAG